MENAGVFSHSFKSVVSCILLFIWICILLISAIWIASCVFFSSFSDLTIISLFSIIWFVAEGVCIYLFWVTKTFPSSSSGIMILPQSSSHSVFSGSAAWNSSLWPCLPGHDTLFLGLSLTSVLWYTFSCSLIRRLTTLLQQQLLLNSSAFCYGGIFPLNSFARVFFSLSLRLYINAVLSSRFCLLVHRDFK